MEDNMELKLLIAQNKGLEKQNKELQAENIRLSNIIENYEKNCKIVADTSFKMSEMILNLKSKNEELQFELDMEKWKNGRNNK